MLGEWEACSSSMVCGLNEKQIHLVLRAPLQRQQRLWAKACHLGWIDRPIHAGSSDWNALAFWKLMAI